jgi:hypothetical protein
LRRNLTYSGFTNFIRRTRINVYTVIKNFGFPPPKHSRSLLLRSSVFKHFTRNFGFLNQKSGFRTETSGFRTEILGFLSEISDFRTETSNFSNPNFGFSNQNFGLSNQNFGLSNRHFVFPTRNFMFLKTEVSCFVRFVFCPTKLWVLIQKNYEISNSYEISNEVPVEQKPDKLSKFRAKVNNCVHSNSFSPETSKKFLFPLNRNFIRNFLQKISEFTPEVSVGRFENTKFRVGNPKLRDEILKFWKF